MHTPCPHPSSLYSPPSFPPFLYPCLHPPRMFQFPFYLLPSRHLPPVRSHDCLPCIPPASFKDPLPHQSNRMAPLWSIPTPLIISALRFSPPHCSFPSPIFARTIPFLSPLYANPSPYSPDPSSSSVYNFFPNHIPSPFSHRAATPSSASHLATIVFRSGMSSVVVPVRPSALPLPAALLSMFSDLLAEGAGIRHFGE